MSLMSVDLAQNEIYDEDGIKSYTVVCPGDNQFA